MFCRACSRHRRQAGGRFADLNSRSVTVKGHTFDQHINRSTDLEIQTSHCRSGQARPDPLFANLDQQFGVSGINFLSQFQDLPIENITDTQMLRTLGRNRHIPGSDSQLDLISSGELSHHGHGDSLSIKHQFGKMEMFVMATNVSMNDRTSFKSPG
jgi:hypothetical protein